MSGDSYSIVGSDGRLERYSDKFGSVTPEMSQQAEQVQADILEAKGNIEKSFIVLGSRLARVKREKLYLALGAETFNEWCDSPQLDIGWRQAHDLIRIVEEVIPLFGAEEMAVLPTVSKMKALLPLLNEPDGDDKIIDAVYEVKDMTVKDTQQYVKDTRGISKPLEDRDPVLFIGELYRGENDVYKCKVFGYDGIENKPIGELTMPAEWWSRWEDRFGRMMTVKE